MLIAQNQVFVGMEGSMERLFEVGYVVLSALLAKVGHRLKRPNVPLAPSSKETLKMARFTLSRPTELEAVAELLWFAEMKHERGDIIYWDDFPTIRTSRGVDCVVLVRTIHFLALLVNREELHRRNAIVLNVPQPNA